ncbi:hypothetical protein [Rubinisphaera sp. JC750]|uniref:hypothetical protein n=1 Tax=Rubinisphaera sp. JC750 TaxID=2898658 RepID=UPI001F2B9BD8|nr:hypothetical protein [Rubinisphaera sp. JC750]
MSFTSKKPSQRQLPGAEDVLSAMETCLATVRGADPTLNAPGGPSVFDGRVPQAQNARSCGVIQHHR